MTNLSQIVSGIRRPRLLVRAARIGSEGYSRSRHLPRLIGAEAAAAPADALPLLLATEEPLDAARRSGRADYSPARHVELLSAIIAEIEIARQSAASSGAAETAPPQDHANASASSCFLRAT